MSNRDVVALGAILDLEMTDVDVPGLRTGRHTSVLLQLDCAFVVLLEIVLVKFVALCLQKHLNPNRVGEVIAGANEFGFRRALRV